jgi:hypothetical protein
VNLYFLLPSIKFSHKASSSGAYFYIHAFEDLSLPTRNGKNDTKRKAQDMLKGQQETFSPGGSPLWCCSWFYFMRTNVVHQIFLFTIEAPKVH